MMVEQLSRTGKAGVCRLSNYHGRPEAYFARWTSFSGRPLAADVLAVISSHVETCCLLERLRNAKDHVTFTLDMEDYYRIKDAETDKKNDSKH